jgi:hypothetical protein
MTERDPKGGAQYRPGLAAKLRQDVHKALIESLRAEQRGTLPDTPPELRAILERIDRQDDTDD